VKWGAAISNGGAGHHCPPAGDGPVGSLLTFDRSPYMTLWNLVGVWWMTMGKHVAVVSSKLL